MNGTQNTKGGVALKRGGDSSSTEIRGETEKRGSEESLFSMDIWSLSAAAAAKSFQSCPTLCDPIDGCPPGFPVPGILQARTLEWVAISFSNV